MLWTFPLALLLQCPIGFGLLCFHFHLCIFWFLFWFLLWFVGYFRSMLFSFHMFEFLIIFSCIWDLLLWHCGQKRWLEWFQFFFQFTKTRFMAQDVIYFGEGSVCTWEKGEVLNMFLWFKSTISILQLSIHWLI